MRCEYEVIRLWEQSTEIFLQSPGLLPFAVLSQTENQEQVLREVALNTETVSSSSIRSNIIAASALLAGLVLKEEFIWQVLKEDIVRESVVYQKIEAEARAKGEIIGEVRGKALGEALGEEKKAFEIALNLLDSGMKVEQVAQITGLSLQKVNKLIPEN